MEKEQDQLYYKGYIAGYRDGIRDAYSGQVTKKHEDDIINLPVKAMAISTRSYNCLVRAGCTYIADVVMLSDQTISTMRNMGTKSASEIAHWLDAQGISYSAWRKYL